MTISEKIQGKFDIVRKNIHRAQDKYLIYKNLDRLLEQLSQGI
jgi:hypothetical protein